MSKLTTILVGLLAVFYMTLIAKPAFAHILVKSDTGSSSMIVHVTPDDDPIAGESSSMFFDIRSSVITNNDYNHSLSITSNGSLRKELELKEVGVNSAGLDYTFPSQGVYDIELRSYSQLGVEEKFSFKQRVSRGLAGNYLAEKKINNQWAEAGLIFSICMIVVILIIVINRRKSILRFSYDNKIGSKNVKTNK